ncbi:MAG: hypothetical protein JSV92_01105 [archaeon]|nr:MAG: hypothetical protein JSV92_01105 [archaeon]
MNKIMLAIIVLMIFVIFGVIVLGVIQMWKGASLGIIDFVCWPWCAMTYNIGLMKGIPSGWCGC